MSADRWSLCPKCVRKHDEYLEELYGKVPSNVFLNNLEKGNPQDTLAEYFEIYLDEDGEFVVHYEGLCRTCGYQFTFDHSEQVELK